MARKKKAGATVRYRGLSGRRIIGDYVWEAANAYTTTVDDPAVLDAIRDDLQFVIEESATDEPTEETQ